MLGEISQEQMLHQSHYYNLMETLRGKDPEGSGTVPSPNTKERWQLISDEFKNRWNVPNACGALDGKHVAIKKPAKSGYQYYNMCFFSTVIMALVDW